jgi:tRNA A37 threonylcarbamoyltransferase TsaD
VSCFTRALSSLGYGGQSGLIPRGVHWRSEMTAIARVLSRAFPSTNDEIETLKTIALFCGVGLVVSLLLAATSGLDMSAGFF